jgi:hypothetical protein
MIAGGLHWADIAFGVNWQVLAPFAHAKVPLALRAYRIGAAMPGIVTGLLPVFVAIALGLPSLFLFGTCFLVLASGDALILWLVRDVPGDALVEDHPSRFGCRIVSSTGRADAAVNGQAAVHPESANRG